MLIEDPNPSREKAVDVLRSIYSEVKLSPFRGIAMPEDIYDKEMATLYVVGKYGMALDQDYPEVFEKIFERERKYEEAAEILVGVDDPESKRRKITSIIGEVNSNELARIFRIFFTKVVFGFDSEDKLIKAIREALKVFPENEKDIKKYARFYIGYKVAEMIATGEVRDKISKEASKQALNIKIGVGKTIPDDNYIYQIARSVFKIPKEKLESILQVRKQGGKR